MNLIDKDRFNMKYNKYIPYDMAINQWYEDELIEKCMNRKNPLTILNTEKTLPAIKNVVFNDPLTIIIWEDGTKTYVKTSGGDTYDPEKGMALAIAKKAMGNKYKYFETIREWIEKDAKKKEKNKKSAHIHPTEERIYIDLEGEKPSVIGNYKDMKKYYDEEEI